MALPWYLSGGQNPNQAPAYIPQEVLNQAGPVQQSAPAAQNNTPQMSRDEYRDKWMSSGPMTWDQMNQWLAQNGGQMLSGNGTVLTPYGDVLDMGYNARGAQAGNGLISPFWTRVNQDGGGNSSGNSSGNISGMSGMPAGLGQLLQQIQTQPQTSVAQPKQQYSGFSQPNQQQDVSQYTQSRPNNFAGFNQGMTPSNGKIMGNQQDTMRRQGWSGFRVS